MSSQGKNINTKTTNQNNWQEYNKKNVLYTIVSKKKTKNQNQKKKIGCLWKKGTVSLLAAQYFLLSNIAAKRTTWMFEAADEYM